MPTTRAGLGLVLPFACMAALLFGLSAWLYLFQLEHILVQVEESRLRFTLADLRADFEKGLDRGFAIRQLPSAQAAIDTELRQDADMVWLCVLDARGAAVFRAGPNAPAVFQVPDHERIDRDDDGATGTTLLTDDAGHAAGALAVRYSGRGHARIMAALTLRLALAALAATCATTACFAWALRRLRRRGERLLAQAAEGLAQHKPERGSDQAVAEMVDQVNQTAATALVEVTAARHALGGSEAAG
ncbi:MAG: hypothetical protein ACXU8N_15985 [Telluria sp.]